MKGKRGIHLISSLLMLGWSICSICYATGDFVVIANLQAEVDKMSKDEVINVYMGRNRRLPSGIKALPIDLENPLAEKANFYNFMVNKELAEISSYWARLMFSGQGSPPRQVMSVEQALEIVINEKGAIAYIDRRKIDKRVKIVFDPSKS
ncbi:hypothetical protein [Undibacterium fentianense]|uniref:Phosphate ABC transporter substrate-binding protein n=1 Tax=Undibacterium fentianense TaxID=2828728 RepID=A0A941E3L2_9BURK|nr:hypothetical protein [Undibacterium fentianense]MBR7799093.1 hypothetical protein [Undibacterium fentianense]